MRSPIEQMIDKACGYDPATAPKVDMVTLRCPKCGRTKRVVRDKTDPPGTAVVEANCDKHSAEGCAEEVFYFDANGKQLLPD